MLHLPVWRFGQIYESLEKSKVVHFHTGEPIAEVSQANGGLVLRDLKRADKARAALREMGVARILNACSKAADLYLHGDLPMGLGGERQSPQAFVHAQSASTGLPEHMCRSNMEKNHFVLSRMPQILDCLTRGLDLEILARGFGVESRGVIVSFQAQAPVLGAVLPSNSPGVHTLWIPAIPLLVGLALKPGSSEPWTPYRLVAAFREAGVPSEAFGLYPGDHDVGSAILTRCQRSMIFGNERTIEQYAGNPRVQVHGPGFSKILLGDDHVDDWEQHLDMMVESVLANGGRSCINASTILASRHTQAIARAIAERIGPIAPLPPTDPKAMIAAFTTPSVAEATWNMITAELGETGVMQLTESFGPRLEMHERCAYLRPIVVHCDSTDRKIALREYMFPFVSVVQCPQSEMLQRMGPTLVATAVTRDESFIDALTLATNIDRLNIGPIPTNRLNWLQPHEGNLVDFLYRGRAYQRAESMTA